MRHTERPLPASQRVLVRSLIALLAPRIQRFAVAALAAFFGVVHVAAISHMAFEAHARCVEHGEIVHVEAGRADPGAPELAAAGASPHAIPSDAHAAEDHDHCALGLAPPGEGRVARGAPAIVLDADDPPAFPPAVFVSQVRSAAVPAPPIAILLLSPKSSPPA